MTRRIDRREFLKRGASLAGAVAGGGLLTARGTQARPGSPKETGIEELAATLEGRVVLPHTPRYRAARLVWNSRYDDARPTAVIQADAGVRCDVILRSAKFDASSSARLSDQPRRGNQVVAAIRPGQ